MFKSTAIAVDDAGVTADWVAAGWVKRAGRLLLASVLAGVLVSALVMGMTVAGVGGDAFQPQPAGAAAARKVSAWLVPWDTARGYKAFTDNADLYSDLSPFWYEMRTDGTIATYEGGGDSSIVSGARSHGVAVLPTITNNFDPARVHTMLATPTSRAAHIKALVDLTVAKSFDGIDIDYESLQASDRTLFSTFVSELASSLHAQGKKLSVTVHPKTSEPGTWDGPQAQDYAAIGRVSDRVRIMAYDYHWATSAAGAVAPLSWVDQVAAFAASVIPPAKVQLGIPLYGYDWVGSTGTGVTFEEANSRRAAAGAARQWSSADSSPWFSYTSGGATHEVWYEDAQSVAAKLAVVDKYGLAGAAFWRLGGEDAGVWNSARSRWGGTAPADTVAPSVPTGLTGSSTRNSVSLSWAAATDSAPAGATISGVSAYDVYRAKGSGAFTKVASPTGTSFTDGSLVRRTTYRYYVRARDAAGNSSGNSATFSIKTR